MPKQSATGMYQESKYIVDNAPGSYPYTTIQSAINDAQAAGRPAEIIIRPGTYTENLILYSGINLRGAGGFGPYGSLIIVGMHTPPNAGTFSAENVEFQSATHVFNSGDAGTATIVLKDSVINVTNGYTFNLQNWTGILIADNIGQTGLNNGEVNNTAGASVFYNNSNFGIGTNVANISGACELFNVSTQCPVLFRGASAAFMNGGCWALKNISLQDTASLEISNSILSTGISAAITTTSTGLVTLSNVSIDSSAANVITGTGTVQFSSVTYITNSGVAGTITKDFTTEFETGILKLRDADTGALMATTGLVTVGTLTVGYGGIGVSSLTDHGVLVGSGSSAITALTVGNTGELLVGATGADPAFGTIAYGNFTFSNVTPATPRTLAVTNADTNAASYSDLRLSVPAAGADAMVSWEVQATLFYSAGIDNSVAGDPWVLSNSSSPSAGNPLISTTSAGVITLFNDLDVSEGGTGVSTLTSHGILMGNGAGDIQATAEPANGQILIGKTGDFPQLAGLTPGPGIAITNGAGTITVSAWGGGVSWTVETVNLNFTVNKGIIANKAGLLTVTLPATAAIGDILEITGINTAVGWRIAQNANQRIHVGAASSTIGIGGYVESTAIRDSIKLVCVVAGASTEYNTLSSFGNLTVA